MHVNRSLFPSIRAASLAYFWTSGLLAQEHPAEDRFKRTIGRFAEVSNPDMLKKTRAPKNTPNAI